MTKLELITKFQLFMDDSSDLSDAEASDLFDKWYSIILSDRPWEFTKKQFSGTTDGTAYIALPADFRYLTVNTNYTDAQEGESGRPVLFVGSNYDPYYVVSWSDRRQYRNRSNFCWVDFANSRIEFASTPTSGLAVEYDYNYGLAALADGESPIFPSDYHDMIYHGMCTDDFVIQQSPKAQSYKEENQMAYDNYFRRLAYYNSNLIQI